MDVPHLSTAECPGLAESSTDGNGVTVNHRIIQYASNSRSSFCSVCLFAAARLVASCGTLRKRNTHKMRFLADVVVLSTLLLNSFTSAIPVKQQERLSLKEQKHFGSPQHGRPFTRKHNDPYDHKIDTVGNGMQPLPFVSILIS